MWRKWSRRISLHLSRSKTLVSGVWLHSSYANKKQVGSMDALHMSPASLYHNVIPSLEQLAIVVDFVHWENRLNPYNHVPHFLKYCTGNICNVLTTKELMTFPIGVSQPEDYRLCKVAVQPKIWRCEFTKVFLRDILMRIRAFGHQLLRRY